MKDQSHVAPRPFPAPPGRFNVLSLCSGVGGLDLGLSLAEPDARTVCYVEGEARCAAILVARMAEEALDEAPVWSDVRSFDPRPWRGLVDCVIGGYPCQPFSLAGKRRGREDPRHLWPSIAGHVRVLRPSHCFFENVAGHLSLGFEEVVPELEGMGYRVAAGLFTAEEVGAPHKRERLFILAKLADPLGPGRAGRAVQRGDGGQEQPPAERVRRHDLVFPPGPDSIDEWRGLLAVSPGLEPAVRQGTHGLGDRVDRLRACGNGVIPLQAAYAYRFLRACIS